MSKSALVTLVDASSNCGKTRPLFAGLAAQQARGGASSFGFAFETGQVSCLKSMFVSVAFAPSAPGGRLLKEVDGPEWKMHGIGQSASH
jgi:hypothetical protein